MRDTVIGVLLGVFVAQVSNFLGVVLHSRWIDRRLAAKKPGQAAAGKGATI